MKKIILSLVIIASAHGFAGTVISEGLTGEQGTLTGEQGTLTGEQGTLTGEQGTNFIGHVLIED